MYKKHRKAADVLSGVIVIGDIDPDISPNLWGCRE